MTSKLYGTLMKQKLAKENKDKNLEEK